ncbi:Hypothetical protein SRAE_X000250300 [Strongyloides ratti]|uniref:Uncharacterized protein n=1 Tax=Strongyloides ratti TaxID=34506 RepID=A0A090KY85_STRRB|nr:Hypothetical protein SRAE_X000250300 [Strongyloides ratti]CEF60827.1 Hypothetical protein SRAE_X000250300 [Strongyloides ratti]
MYYNIIFLNILILYFTTYGRCAPTPPSATECKSCHGGCYSDGKKIHNQSERTLKENTTDFKKNNRTISRNKRESTIERRACVSLFHVELFVIPLSIAMIPIALCSLLFCACYCGPKETRGKMPEKMWGIKLSNVKKDLNKRSSISDSIADSIYEYQENYCRRVDSKKTRFNTSVVVIETRRISEAEISLPPLSPKHITSDDDSFVGKVFNKDYEKTTTDNCMNIKKSVKKITRFSNNIEILGCNEGDKNESTKVENCNV